MTRLTPFAAALLLLASTIVSAQHTVTLSRVTAENAWVREPIAERPITGAYLTLRNPTGKPIRLTSVATPAARVSEMHRMVMKDDQMRMEKIEFIEIPAGGSVELRPGGLHLMLIDLVAPLKAGGKVRIELSFDDGSSLTIDAPVRAGEAASPQSHAPHSSHH
jgi:copper(I)-binding protein